jgi:Tol biopolymer transport system component
MFKNLTQIGRWTAIAVAIGLVCSMQVLAKKPPPPPEEPTAAEVNPAIAYVQTQKNGTVHVVVAAADLGSQVVLTQSVQPGGRQFGSPAWSADGQFVAFWGQDKDANGNPLPMMLFIARADASQVTLVRDFSMRPGPGPAFFADGLNWTPSGKELIYSPCDNSAVIVAIDSVNGDTRYLLDLPTGDGNFQPALSPDLEEQPGYQGFLAMRGFDGSQSPDGERRSDIFIVPIDDDADGYLLPVDPTLFLNVTNKPGSKQYHPSWSRDGEFLACFDDGSLAVCDVVTGASWAVAPNYLTGVNGEDRPTWTSDGNELVFRSTDIGSGDLAIVAADGSGPVVNYTATRNITERAPAWNPAWDPSGPGGF